MDYEIHLQICLSKEEYALQRTPYFLHFAGHPPTHVKVQSFCYLHDCILEVSFFHHTSVLGANMRAPAVCFHPDDTGDQDDARDSLYDVYTER